MPITAAALQPWLCSEFERMTVNRPALYCVWLGTLLAASGHAFHTPAWATALFYGLACIHLLSTYLPYMRKRTRLRRYTDNALMLMSLLAIYAGYGDFGKNSGTVALSVLCIFKLRQIYAVRDFYIATFMAYFLGALLFLDFDSPLAALYTLLNLVILTVGLALLHFGGPRKGLWKSVKLSVQLLAQATPLMVAAFILFPRIPGPLWGLPADSFASKIGISDRMTLGSISRIAQSAGEIVFRADFYDRRPENSSLYWRGPVFWYTDGKNWTPGTFGTNKERRLPQITGESQPIPYSITLEPHGKNWIFALDIPTNAPSGTRLNADLQLLSATPVNKRQFFQLSAYQNYRISSPHPVKRDAHPGLQLPAGKHPRTVALARSWREENLSDKQIMRKALSMMHNEGFFYTLTPKAIQGDPVDAFLFDTREGFCEHYAAAFTVLMRAAGIPARIVTGYQGGDFKPIGGYYAIHSQSAHAWVEVWLEGKGWDRVDPTSAVAPERIQRGMEDFLATFNPSQSLLFQLRGGNLAVRLWQNIRDLADAMINNWNHWILFFGEDQQRYLLNKIGIGELNAIESLGLLVLLSATLLLLFHLWALRRISVRRDPAKEIYDLFCRKLAKKGVEILPHQGPLDLSQIAQKRLPPCAPEIAAITDAYIHLRYGTENSNTELLKRMVRSFPEQATA